MKLFEHILGTKVNKKIAEGSLIASTQDGFEGAIEIFHDDISKYPRDLFKISLVNTPYTGEKQVTALRFIGQNTRTIGYVFSIYSLRTGVYLPENKWPRIYAAAATRELVETEIAVNLLVRNNFIDSGKAEITDFFPENLGVLVLGCEQIDERSASIEEVELMLMEFGYVPRSVDFVSSNVTVSGIDDYQARLSIRNLSRNLIDEAFGLKWLMASSFVHQTSPGRFLSLYQILESILSRVFSKAMGHMIADPRSQIDPWWVRDTIYKIQAEKWRLNFIEQHCLQTDMTRRNFRNNCEACKALLINLKKRNQNDNNLAWSSTLYAVRNIFVHNQIALSTAESNLIDDVCVTLRDVCFELMNGYVDPSSDFLNEGI